MAGLSIGLLAGAAVSLSRTLHDLTNTGAESVRVAFRLGVYIDDISRKVEARDPAAPPQSWAYVVTGLSEKDVQQEIDKYNADTVSVLDELDLHVNQANLRPI